MKRFLRNTALILTAIVGSAVAARPAKADTIVPIVGTVQGANNSLFKSDLKLYNPTNDIISGKMVFTERGNSMSDSDTTMAYSIPPHQVLFWENIYDAAKPGQAGAARIQIIPDAINGEKVEPIVSTNTYTKLADGGELGQVPTPFKNTEFYGPNVVLAGMTGKSTQRFNSFVMTGPQGATIEYTVRNSANGQTLTDTHTYGPNATYQFGGGTNHHVGVATPPNSSLEVKIIAGSARFSGNAVDNRTNQGAWEDFRQTHTPLPRILGIDRNGDGIIDIPDADGNYVIDGVINVDCNAPFPWEGRFITNISTPYNVFSGEMPQGMILNQGTGAITYDPPCDSAGSVYTPRFTVSGNEQNATIVQFRVN